MLRTVRHRSEAVQISIELKTNERRRGIVACEPDGDLLSSAPGSSEWAVLYRVSISSLLAPKGSVHYKSDFTHHRLTQLHDQVDSTQSWSLALIYSFPPDKYPNRAPNQSIAASFQIVSNSLGIITILCNASSLRYRKYCLITQKRKKETTAFLT